MWQEFNIRSLFLMTRPTCISCFSDDRSVCVQREIQLAAELAAKLRCQRQPEGPKKRPSSAAAASTTHRSNVPVKKSKVRQYYVAYL